MRLVVEGLSATVLEDCHLHVAAGEIVTLRGTSGSGKTMLLRAIADLDPHVGEVWLGDARRSSMSGPEWRRRVRFVAAEAAWWADRVGEHFRAPGAMGKAAIALGLTEDCMGWQVARLSSGEKQRLGILRAVEDRPKVLLFDEPTAALDAESERAVESLIRKLRAEGAAIVIVTHSDSQTDRLADRHYVIEKGRLREEA